MEILPTARTMDIDLSKQRTVKWGKAIGPTPGIFHDCFSSCWFPIHSNKEKVETSLNVLQMCIILSRSKRTANPKSQHSNLNQGRRSPSRQPSPGSNSKAATEIFKTNNHCAPVANSRVLKLNLNEAVTGLNKPTHSHCLGFPVWPGDLKPMSYTWTAGQQHPGSDGG